MSRSLKIHEFIALNQRCLHTGNVLASGSSKIQRSPARGPRKSANSQVHENLKAIRSLISEDSEVSSKVKKLLGTDDSWIRTETRRFGVKATKRVREGNRVPGSNRVTLPPVKLLQPHEVSQTVKRLSAERKLDEAIDYVSNLPLDALNVSVWNTLVWEANRAERYNVAWSLYNGMKKRGFEPSTYSYKTMLNGLTRIDDFTTQTLALERAHKLYQSFIQYTNTIRKKHPDHPELYPVPIHFYMYILSKAGLRQQMWDTFYAMDKEGPISPNASTFASMLQSLAWRPAGDNSMTDAEWNAKVGSEAALLWRLMVNASKGNPGFEIDSHALAAVLRLLAKGGPADQTLAYDIIHKYLNLRNPEEYTPLMTAAKQMPQKKSPQGIPTVLTCFTLQAALELCRITQKPQYAVSYIKQIMEKGDEASVLDLHNINQLFGAYYDQVASSSVKADVVESTTTSAASYEISQHAVASLQWLLSHAATYFAVKHEEEKRLWPTISTYNIVLATCRECGDWDSARTTLEMMVGRKVGDLVKRADTPAGAKGSSIPVLPMLSVTVPKRSPTRRQYFRPTAESIFSLMRCAYNYAQSKNKPATAHECLSMVNALGGDELLTEPYTSSKKVLYDLISHPSQNSKVAELDATITREEERKKYWAVRAAAVVPALFSVATKSGGWNREEYKKAAEFRSAATDILKSQKEAMGSQKEEQPSKAGKKYSSLS